MTVFQRRMERDSNSPVNRLDPVAIVLAHLRQAQIVEKKSSELGASAEVRFLVNSDCVLANGALTTVRGVGNFLVAFAFQKQERDFLLNRRKSPRCESLLDSAAESLRRNGARLCFKFEIEAGRKCRRAGSNVVLSYGGRSIRLRPGTTRHEPRLVHNNLREMYKCGGENSYHYSQFPH